MKNFIYIFFITSIFFYTISCSRKYTLKPCYKVSKKNIYNKIFVSKEAKISIKTNHDIGSLYLSTDTQKFDLPKVSKNVYESKVVLKKGAYILSKDLKNVQNIKYIYSDDYLFNINSKEKALKQVKAKTIRNSVSKCLSNTSDWYEIIPRSKCYGSNIFITLLTKSSDIDFEILKNNESLGLLEKSKTYKLSSKDKNIVHVFTDSSGISSYLLKIEEECFPKVKELKVINKIDIFGSSGLLLNNSDDIFLVKGMKFYYLADKSLNYCFIKDVSNNSALCVFGGIKIKKVPKEVYFYDYEIQKP